MTDTKPAIAHEALNEPVSVDFGGTAYSVPATAQWDYDILEAFEEGRVAGFLKALLGPVQHGTFKATRPKLSEVNEFMLAIQRALGISGN